jgi:ATP-dependent Clp protease ATP-binding subunit ClpA
MNDDIRTLLEALRRGQYDDPGEKIALLAAALREHEVPFEELAALLRAPQVPLRLAAVEACRGRQEDGVTVELSRLATDADVRVRIALAESLAQQALTVTAEAFGALMRDDQPGVRSPMCRAAAGSGPWAARLREMAGNDPDWNVRREALRALGDVQDAGHAALLLKVIVDETDDDVRQFAVETFDKGLGVEGVSWPGDWAGDGGPLIKAERILDEAWYGGRFPRFKAWLKARTASMVDLAGLARFGVDLTAQAQAGGLGRAFEVQGELEALMERLMCEPARPVALVGRSGCGKTAMVHELARLLALPENGGWRVLRMAPSDFLTGTKYVGEWETRVRDLVAAIRHPRRVILYVPNLADLAAVGRWEKSDVNVAAALAPHLEDGSLRLLGESTPEEFERGLGREPALARLFDRVLVEPAGLESTRRIVRAIRDQAGLPAADEVLDALVDASEFYLSHVARPGGAAGLLRAVLEERRGDPQPVVRRDILVSLSRSTGVPVDLLDDSVPLDLAALKGFFEARIIGQPDAVQAVVDLVTLVKAGVTDPGKPFGVMLFVGPTGVGKTELARVLAEYIFGDAGRLVRFDMSEFASPEGFTRLIGGRGENGLLTDAVRQRPFSVILLDEIEKSHLNVFDLCLQVFDAGRLTDGHGRLVDFRRSIVILTSNVGAEAPVAEVGFGGRAAPRGFGDGGGGGGGSPAGVPDADRTFRELSRFFRPEFLNRLDRIVHFAPLSMDVAERIARRELDLVLQRSGVARRDLTVSVDPEVISLLVREGYSPHFGARPLKRTVERLVLLPLGRALATGRLGAGDLVTLKVREGRVEVGVVARGGAAAGGAGKPGRDAGSARETRGGPAEDCLRRIALLKPGLAARAEQKSQLIERTRQPGFYADAALRESTFDELHKLDGFLARAERCFGRITSLASATTPDTGDRSERWDELAAELRQIERIGASRDARELGDVLVTVRWVSGKGEGLDAVPTLTRMYLALAERLNLTAQVLAEHTAEGADVAYLQIVGLGAFSLMTAEVGLHEFRRRHRARARRGAPETDREDLAVVAVEIVPLAGAPDRRFGGRLTVRTTPIRPAVTRLVEGAGWVVEVFDADTVRSLVARYPGARKAAIEAATALLWSLVGGPGRAGEGGAVGDEPAGVPELIRLYELGQGACIRDLRTGRSTTRVAHVFRGQLDLLARR